MCAPAGYQSLRVLVFHSSMMVPHTVAIFSIESISSSVFWWGIIPVSDWDEMSSLSERECLMSSHSSGSQLGSTASQKLKARSSDGEQVCREEDEGGPTKRAKSMDKHNENERIRFGGK